MDQTLQTTILPSFDDIESVMSETPIFGGLDHSQLQGIYHYLEYKEVPQGEAIFLEGDCPTYIYIILQGKVRLVFDYEGLCITKAELMVGACFGETSVIGIQPHSATTIADEDCRLLLLSGNAMADLFNKDKALFAQLILNISRESCRRLYHTNKQLIHYVRFNAAKDSPDISGY